MGLKQYQQKRDFRRTPEPPANGQPGGGRGYSFVVQRHAARRLHYDFRLELDGVLKSWAVPKGPSLDPGVKSLAVHVEDHPLDYGGFEGVIPAGEYGGGTVMLFDQGTWEPLEDPQRGYERGKLKFRLHGQRLKGTWNLVRSGRRSDGSSQDQWLLMKRKDDQARPADGHQFIASYAHSVSTGRTMDEIARQADRVWSSQGGEQESRPAPTGEGEPPGVQALPGARQAPMPQNVSPQLPTLVDAAPSGDEWLHELKFDGYRLIGLKDDDTVRLITRRGNDWTDRFPAAAEAIQRLPERQLIVDGEIVALNREGISDFQALQNAMKSGRSPRLTYFLFDLLYLAGYDLTDVPLIERKRLLNGLLAAVEPAGDQDVLRYSDHIQGQGPGVFRHACRYALEGVVSKRADSRYVFRRSRSWLKSKCRRRQEFVIGGYTDPKGARDHFGALLLGYYDDAGRLVYCGRAGTGFTARSLADLAEELASRSAATCPFSKRPPGPSREFHWVRPELVAEVEFAEWTADNQLRQPSFQGLREDKDPRSIGRETASPVETVQDEAPDAKARATTAARSAAKTAAETKAKSRARKKPAKATAQALGKAETAAADPAASEDEAAAETAARPKKSRSTARGARMAGVRISNPDKVLYPEQNVVKSELARYYDQIADWILPHLIDRPLAIVRCPHGWQKGCFFQKHFSEGMAEPIRSLSVQEDSGREQFIGVADRAGLVTLAQLGVLEIHPWGARADRPDRPDRMIFDLDPGQGVAWSEIVDAALVLRQWLQQLGLESFVRTTGGKGLHVVTPLERRSRWPEVKAFSRALARRFVRRWPQRFIAKATRSQRQGKIYVDYLRNSRGATAVASYSPRARSGATVAAPLGWDELPDSIGSDQYHLGNLPPRLQALPQDPWTGFFDVRQVLSKASLRAVGVADA